MNTETYLLVAAIFILPLLIHEARKYIEINSTKMQVSEVALHRSLEVINDKGEPIIDYIFCGYATFIDETTLISTINVLHNNDTKYKIHFGPESNPFILDIKDSMMGKQKYYLFLHISLNDNVEHDKYTISPLQIYQGDAKIGMVVTLSFAGSQYSIPGEGNITDIWYKNLLTVLFTFPDNDNNKKLEPGKAITTDSGSLIGLCFNPKLKEENGIISTYFVAINTDIIKEIS